MAGNGIGVSLQVDGETKFKTAMKNAAKAVSDVDSRLKLATAEFKKNGDAQKLMQTRSKTLNEEIKRQTQIVNSLDDALKTTERQYGENSTQALHYEAQLNRAQQKLIQMQTALANNAQGLDENGRAFEDAGDQAEKAALSFSDVSQAITNVQQAAKSAATHVINFGKAAWNAMTGASEYADSLLTLSAQTGLNVEQLQRYAMASGLVDTEVSAIYTAMARMVNPADQMAAALKSLGVQTTYYERTGSVMKANAIGQMNEVGLYQQKARSALDIFWDTVDALNALDDAVRRDELTKEIFGKSYVEMKPLIDAGRKGWEDAGKELQSVASEDNIKKLGEFNDKLQVMDAELQGLKTNILAELAPGFSTLADSFTTLIRKFNEWATSKEGQEALGNLSDAIGNILKGISEDDFKTLVSRATDVIEGLASAINSITNDPSGIIDSVKLALAGYATLSVSKQVLSLLTLLRSLGGSGIAGNISSTLGKLGNFFAPGAAAEGTGEVTAGAAGHIAPLGSIKVGSIIAGAEAAGLVAAGVEAGVHMVEEVTDQGTLLGIGARDEHGAIDIGGFKFGGDAETTSLWSAIATSLGIKPANNAGATEYRDGMTGMTKEEIEAAAETYKQVGIVTTEVATSAGEAADAVGDMNDEYEKFAEQWRYIGMPEEEIQQLYETIKEQGSLVVEGVGETGANAGGALAAGLLSSLPSIAGAVSRINAVVATIGGGTPSVGFGGARAGNTFTRNNSIYINNLNQANAADIYDTLRSMNGAQEHVNRGWGYVPG